MSSLRSNVLAARERLADGIDEFRQRHHTGCSGIELCAALTRLRDGVLQELFDVAVAEFNETGLPGLRSQLALVAHGGYGRCDVAPYSDVDLMLLHEPRAGQRVGALAKRLWRDLFDVGLIPGHSVRTPDQACRLALADPKIFTSLVESRLLVGSSELFDRFTARFRRQIGPRPRPLMVAIERTRREERIRYGETVYLLEPNVKRSRGGLRDLQLLRWIAFARYGTPEPDRLLKQEVLNAEDHRTVSQASEFLLRLRNEMHFHAGRAVDVLDRAEQLRIAEAFGYCPSAGILSVEHFMRDYFRQTNRLSHVVERFVAKAQSHQRLGWLVTTTFGHRVEGGVRVGPAGLMASRQGFELLRGSLTEVMRLVGLSNLYDKPIAPATWEVVRREAARLPDALPAEACHRFVSLLDHPARLGPLLQDLHETRILERFIPEFDHARGLLQFNQYHKYTVDEHCLRAVEFAAELYSDSGVLGRVYRRIAHKHVLHLALLIHDLGKGFPEDHSEVAVEIAERASQRLGLSPHETEALRFLAGKHLLMNHLAFRRDTSDRELVVRFAAEVGSPEMLQMLFVLTAADFAAVGPGVWDGWKEQILADLYHRTMQHLAGESPATVVEQQLHDRRQAVRARLGPAKDSPWFVGQLGALPAGYLTSTEPDQVVADLQTLHDLLPGETAVDAQFQPETEILQVTVATRELVSPGIFHKLTGALSGRGLQICSAAINTFADDLVLDRFWVRDPDFTGKPSPDRFHEIQEALLRSLHSTGEQPPPFRRTWQAAGKRSAPGPSGRTRVEADNTTSDRCTILDVFAHDAEGLLYAVTRALFELDLSVWRAKIGTYLDQVVDVFYVTDRQGNKIQDEPRLQEIRRRLFDTIDSLPESP